MTLRDASVTASCLVCGRPLPAGRPRRTCSDACRQAAWRRRHSSANEIPDLPGSAPRKPVTVYQCGECSTKLLGEQWCQECAQPMRRLGTGGLCPCCDEPVTVNELLGIED